MRLEKIKQALENDEFTYYYQPKVSMISGEICGAEALIRWQKPDGTIIPPFEFIPLAESSGFITDITLSMFEKLIIDMNIIHDIRDSLGISFNASGKDFLDNRLTDKIHNATTDNLIAPNRLKVELTETEILNEKNVNRYLNVLQEIGIGIAMDDFATGYSSIDTLSRLPFSCIKIDQGVVGRMEHSEKDATIVKSSIQLAHELDLETIAEGIETEKVYQLLVNAGCSIGQGYWLSHPLPLHDFIEFLGDGRCWHSSLNGMLYMAQLDHIKWRKAIIDGVFFLGFRNDKDTRLRGMPELDPYACRLGKWYYGAGKRFAGTEWYDKLEEPHNRLHELGVRLIELAQHGASDKEIMSVMRKLSEMSIVVINMLQKIENETVPCSMDSDTDRIN